MRRNDRNKKMYFRHFLIYLAIILVIIGGTYLLYFSPHEIKAGILLDRKDTGNKIALKLGYGNNIKWIKINKNVELEDSVAYNVKLLGLRLKSITPCSVYTGQVFKKDSKTIQLESGEVLKLKENVHHYKIVNEELIPISSNSVISGASDYKFIGDDKGNVQVVLVNPINIDLIRVGISNRDFSSLKHTELIFTTKKEEREKKFRGKGITILYDNKEYKTKTNDQVRIQYVNNEIKISLVGSDSSPESDFLIGTSKNKIKLLPINKEKPISIPTLIRGKESNNYTPMYYGEFEIFIEDDALKLINSVPLESYLKTVVPSEIPANGGIIGYKVQAIAARTYVLSDMLSGRFTHLGFHVDDTTLTQVYNSQKEQTLCNQAIEETKGMVMTYKGKIIDAKYYSTSPGVGAPYNEIYYSGYQHDVENPKPYLTFMNFTNTNIDDLSDEDKAEEFFKNWTINSYDSNFSLFRWKVTLDGKQLIKNINENIYKCYVKSPDSFKKEWHFKIFTKTKITEAGIGKIKDLFINKRGKAGNILEMTIVTEDSTYRVHGEYNIKKLLTLPEFTLTPLYGKDSKDYKALPSPFFIIEKKLTSTSIKEITLYGGGFGHGVGMSQNGVIGLVRLDKDYTEILNTFYKNVRIINYKDAIKTFY